MALEIKVDFDTARTFVQTDKAPLPELDTWTQIGQQEVAVVADMTRRNELSGGTPTVRDFERRWRNWIGARYAISVMNGTSALYCAYFGLGVGPGDEVICPVNTWICTIAPALLLGARPVFCDIDPATLLLDPDDVRRKVTDRTACIVAVHLWGNVCDMDAVRAIGIEHGIPILEDCSHAHGARYQATMCGAIGDVGCWSLQGTKPVSAGEGGMLVTNRTEVFERACLLGQVNRVQGIDLVTATYQQHQPLGLGMKFRAHPLAIGIAGVQLDKLAELNARRHGFITAIEEGLASIPGLRPVTVLAGAQRAGFYGFPVLYDGAALGGVSLRAFVDAANQAGLNVSTCPYPNLHTLALFADGFDLFTGNRGPLSPSHGYRGYRPGDFPKAEHAQEHTLFLPRLSCPVADAPRVILETLRQVAETVAR
ncbi:MAG: hypothetical protein A2W31_01240 [Planctomycetes bacterium RBG_16_64_10]|nr:MAG: hypothetical protein A2W31_01240 [Planctomycetes bacterium RBG_16_64_10]